MAVHNVATATLLTAETPAGNAATMTLNTSASGLGQAAGAAVGGMLLTLGGFDAVGLGTMVWVACSAVVVWWTRPATSEAG